MAGMMDTRYWFTLGLLLLVCFASVSRSAAAFDDYEAAFEKDEAAGSLGGGAGEYLYDEEEFIGLEELQAEEAEQSDVEEVAPTAMPEMAGEASGPTFMQRMAKRDWTLEAAFGTIIAIYLANFMYGKEVNHTLARKWLERYFTQYRNEFHLVGYGEARIVKEGHNIYTLSASGRRNCRGSITELNLIKRHDLISVVMNFLTPTKDYLTIDVPILGLEPLVCAVVKPKGRADFIEGHEDVQNYAKQLRFDKLDDFSCLADNQEVLTGILGAEVVHALNENCDLVEEIYVTDSHPTYVNRENLHLKFVLPSDLERLDLLMKMSFFLIDIVASVKLSKNGLASAKKQRAKADQRSKKELHQQRQEAAQQRKLEKEQKQRDKLALMSEEEQEKWMEKDRKKQQRRKLAKQKMQVVM